MRARVGAGACRPVWLLVLMLIGLLLPFSRAQDWVAQSASYPLEEGDGAAVLRLEEGDRLLATGRVDEAFSLFTELLRRARLEGDRSLEAEALYGVASVEQSRSYFVTALEYYLRALDVAESSGHQYIISAIHNNIGTIHHMNGDEERALASYRRSLAAIDVEEDPIGTAQVFGNIGDIHRRLGNFEEAHDYFDRAMDILSGYEGDELATAFILGNRGQTFLAEGRSRNAVEYLEQCVAINEEFENQQSLAERYINLGEAYAQVGAREKGIDSIRRGIEMASLLMARRVEWLGYESLSRLFWKADDCESAMHYSQQASELHEEFMGDEKAVRLADLHTLYEVRQKEKELDLLRKDMAIAQLEAQKAYLIRNALIGLVVLGAFLLLVLYNRYRLKTRTTEIIRDKNEALTSAYRQMEEMARTDPLTHLLNRRAMLERLEDEVNRVERSGQTFSVVLADVDCFKKFNDRHGHDCGDRVLKAVATAIQSTLRKQDAVARWGGEEFLILLPDTEQEGAAVIAERIRSRVAETSVQESDCRLSVTLTLGVSDYRTGGSTPDCIRKADSALYRGKSQGRNQVVAA